MGQVLASGKNSTGRNTAGNDAGKLNPMTAAGTERFHGHQVDAGKCEKWD